MNGIENMKRVKGRVKLSLKSDRGQNLNSTEVKRKRKSNAKVNPNVEEDMFNSNCTINEMGVKKIRKNRKEELNVSRGSDDTSSEQEGGEVRVSMKKEWKRKQKKKLHTLSNKEGDEKRIGHAERGESSELKELKLKQKKKKISETNENSEERECTSDDEALNGILDSIVKKKEGKKRGKKSKIKKKKAKMMRKMNLPASSSFHEMGLDDRLLEAIARLAWENPSDIQLKAIPAILRGRNVVMEAETGSGKTGAFGIPVIQKMIDANKINMEQTTRALILVPSVELVMQTCQCLRQLSAQCSNITTCPLTNVLSVEEQVPLIELGCDIVVGTPCRILEHLEEGNLKMTSVEILVVDEADTIFLLGFEEAMSKIFRFMPKVYQMVMCTATVTHPLKSIVKTSMYDPLFLKTQKVGVWSLPKQLKHFYLHAKDDDKAFTLYAMLKLGLIRGRTLIFVNSVDKCYKVKLFLEQFSIKSCVVNSELPALSRMHTINQFNSEKYNLVIASDEFYKKPKEEKSANKDSEKTKNKGHKNWERQENKDMKEKKSNRKKAAEFNLSRGIDFQNVSNVVLFDLPVTVDVYIHRAGRTARMNNEGTVLSFVAPWQQSILEKIDKYLMKSTDSDKPVMQKLQFKAEELDGFRYRSKDAWKAVTRVAVREARLMEIKSELFNCKALKGYFEENPADFNSLRHDRILHTVKQPAHLHHVPEYIVPPSLIPWYKGDKVKKKETEGAEDDLEESDLEELDLEMEMEKGEDSDFEQDVNRNRRQSVMTRTQKRYKRKVEDPLSLGFKFKRRKANS